MGDQDTTKRAYKKRIGGNERRVLEALYGQSGREDNADLIAKGIKADPIRRDKLAQAEYERRRLTKLGRPLDAAMHGPGKLSDYRHHPDPALRADAATVEAALYDNRPRPLPPAPLLPSGEESSVMRRAARSLEADGYIQAAGSAAAPGRTRDGEPSSTRGRPPKLWVLTSKGEDLAHELFNDFNMQTPSTTVTRNIQRAVAVEIRRKNPKPDEFANRNRQTHHKDGVKRLMTDKDGIVRQASR